MSGAQRDDDRTAAAACPIILPGAAAEFIHVEDFGRQCREQVEVSNRHVEYRHVVALRSDAAQRLQAGVTRLQAASTMGVIQSDEESITRQTATIACFGTQIICIPISGSPVLLPLIRPHLLPLLPSPFSLGFPLFLPSSSFLCLSATAGRVGRGRALASSHGASRD